MAQEKTKEDAQDFGMFDFSDLMGIDDKEEVQEQEVEVPEAASEEEAEEPVKEEEAQEAPEEAPSQMQFSEDADTSAYTKLTQKYIELGLWSDAKLEIDGEEKVLSELSDIDEETFLQIHNAQQEQKDSELEENYVDVRKLDPTAKQLFDIASNGGDITELIRIQEQFINPLKSYDLENEAHQEDLVRQMYLMDNKNLSKKQIDALVASDKSDLVLDKKAKEFTKRVEDSYQKTIEHENAKALEAQENEKKSLRDLKSNVKKELKEFGVNEKSIDALLNASVNKGEKGLGVDEQFNQLKADPKKLAEFIVWYNNPDDYFKKVGREEATKKDNDILKTLKLVPRNSGKKATKAAPKQKDNVAEELMSRLGIGK